MTEFENPAERVVPATPSAADEWESRAIDSPADYPVKKERLFSRKVLIGWALFTVVAYFGIQIAVTAIKSSLREAVRSGVVSETDDGVVIKTRNGTKISIGRDRRQPGVTITRTTPEPIPPPKPTTPASGAPEVAGAPKAEAAPPAPQAIPPEIRKR